LSFPSLSARENYCPSPAVQKTSNIRGCVGEYSTIPHIRQDHLEHRLWWRRLFFPPRTLSPSPPLSSTTPPGDERPSFLSFRFQTWVSPLTQWKKLSGGAGLPPFWRLQARRPAPRPPAGSAFGLLQFKQHVPPALQAAAAAAAA
jgi:hypothetical protein